ncbi:hypothetical protein ACFQRC_13610 [Enterovirga sp. GCM10030262]|uniref:hypothetical protein n=1 Tax=Enterovirga sp. GCM10030262 TaxID=3273391 RepID=UPI00361CEC27
MIDGLDEQSPRIVAKLVEARFGEGSMLDFPRIARLRDQAGFHLIFAGEPRQLVRIERIAPGLPRIFDQQRLLLPVFGQESVNVEMSELHTILTSFGHVLSNPSPRT